MSLPVRYPDEHSFFQENKKLTFPGSDLDSLCSAIVLAYIRTHTPPHVLHVPLSNLTRDDLSLRPEMTAVLRHAGLATSDLLTLSDLPEMESLKANWLLVDHNAPTGHLRGRPRSEFIGCIDHHADEDFIPKETQPRVVEPCGSCMSLVVEESKNVWKDLIKMGVEESDLTEENSRLSKLALAPILIDTTNLEAKDKVQPKDTEAVRLLEGLVRDVSFDRTQYFNAIAEVKSDISQLSLRDIFRKDYKEWQDGEVKLGISSVVQNLDYLIGTASRGQDDFLAEFGRWAEERSLDLASIMTTSHDDEGNFARELLVWGTDDKGKAVLEHLERDVAGQLQLQAWRDGELDGPGRRTWRQMNLSASRKQVAPLIREAMGKH